MSSERLRVLVLGDVCAEPGRRAVTLALPGLREKLGIDFVIANGENVAGGYGVTPKLAEELFRAGVDCLTTGDHVFDRKEAWEYVAGERRVLRPLNYPPDAPGRGFAIYNLRLPIADRTDSHTPDQTEQSKIEDRTSSMDDGGVKIAVVNLAGRVFMKPLDCPFRRAMPVVNDIVRETPIVIVDMHAEATAEKQAMGWFLDGKVSAVLGTHTHVQTADEKVLPGGTAYLTDVGMCGSFDSVLGMNKELSIRRLIDMVPLRLLPGRDDLRLNGAVVDIEVATGRALGIERLVLPVAEPGNQNPAG
jgi:2',3'-cyclic-nucleotide 2'-phosphodiesterase